MKIVELYSIVKQGHEIYKVMKELKNFGYLFPDKFMMGCIIPKLATTEYLDSFGYFSKI